MVLLFVLLSYIATSRLERKRAKVQQTHKKVAFWFEGPNFAMSDRVPPQEKKSAGKPSTDASKPKAHIGHKSMTPQNALIIFVLFEFEHAPFKLEKLVPDHNFPPFRIPGR